MLILQYALLLSPALASPRPPHAAKSAAFFLDNRSDGSSIVSIDVFQDGTLGGPRRTSTEGYGSSMVNGTGFPPAADSLGSQSSVIVSGDALFTVNAGSNTVVMFRINPNIPSQLSIVGRPAPSLGDFPISLTYSEALRTLCVLNGGANAGVACFSADPRQGLKNLGGLRPLGDALHETTPPSGPPGSAAQIGFNPDSSAVFITTKGNPGVTPKQPGHILAWPVQGGQVQKVPVRTQILDTYLDFGFSFLSKSRLFVVDPSYGASVLTIDDHLKITETVHTAVASQKAICWAEYDANLGSAYGNDAGQDVIYTFSAATGALTGSILFTTNGTSNLTGAFDGAISGAYMYILSAAPGVVVLDLARRSQIQFLDLGSLGSRQGWMGMAVFGRGNFN